MSKGGAIRWSDAQLADFEAKRGRPTVPATAGTKAPLDIPVFAPKAAADNAKARLQALGRLRDGHMNSTETAYSQYLDALLHDGEILWYKFEGIKLKLADRTHITIDFAILTRDGHLCMHDVKGAKAIVTDDAKAKTKIAAAMYPFQFFMVYPQKMKDGGGWIIEKI